MDLCTGNGSEPIAFHQFVGEAKPLKFEGMIFSKAVATERAGINEGSFGHGFSRVKATLYYV
jgi:hypothetical protein